MMVHRRGSGGSDLGIGLLRSQSYLVTDGVLELKVPGPQSRAVPHYTTAS